VFEPPLAPAPHDLRVEHRRTGLGIGAANPRLSWRLPALDAGVAQAGFELAVERDSGPSETVALTGAGTHLVDWPFAPLAPRERAEVRVRARLSDRSSTGWSEPLAIERGLSEADWHVDFVAPSTQAPTDEPRPGHLLRAELEVPADAVRVRAYLTAHGVYDVELDGQRVTTAELAPGWSSYQHRIRYQTLDLDAVATPGTHAIGVWLADGWYRGRLGFGGGTYDLYGTDVAALVQVEVRRADGTVTHLPLDWRCAPAPITAASLYDGESYDARLEQPGWSTPGFDDTAWQVPQALPRTSFAHAIEVRGSA